MGSNLQIIINGVDQASDTFGDVGNAMDSLTGKAGGLLSKGLGPLQSMLGVGLKVAAGVAATAVGGLAAGLASSVSDAADFQQGMADIQASMGASTEETAQLKNLILDLGIDPKLKVSAEEAAQAIGQLGTAGVSIDDIMNGAARSTVLLANATGADFADAASIASDVSKLWSIDAGDLTHAVDGITAATVASKFNINDYRLALAQAGGVASTVGVSFDDFNATIAAISPSFASGSDAGTSLKVLLQRLVPSSDKAKDAMKDLGLMTALTGTRQQAYQKMLDEYKGKLAALGPKTKENAKDYKGLSDAVDNLTSIMQTGQNAFFDEKGNMKSMAEVAGILNKAFKGLSEEQKNQYLSTIFGTDAMRAAAALAKMTTGDFENLQTTMAKTDAAESAKTRMDTLKGSLEILSGTFDTLKLMVGDKFLPVLNDLVKRFNDFLGAQAPMIVEWAGVLATKLGDLVTNYLPSFITKLGEWWNWAKQLAGTLLDVGNQVWNFITGVKTALQPVIDFIGQFVGLKEILLGVAAVFGVAAVASFASFVASLAPVLALLGTAITVVAAFRDGWSNGFGVIREMVAGVMDYLNNNLPKWLESLSKWGTALFQWIADNAPRAIDELTDWLDGMLSWGATTGQSQSQEMFAKLGVAMLSALGKVGIALGRLALTVAGDLILAFAQGLLNWMGIDVSLASLHDHMINLIDVLANALSGKAALIGGALLAALIPGFSGLISTIGGLLLPALGSLATGLLALLGPVGIAIAAIAGLVVAWQTDFLGIREYTYQAFEYIKNLFFGLRDNAMPALVTLGAGLAVLTGPIGIVAAAVAGLYLAWTNNFMGIQDKAKEVFGWLSSALSGLPATLESAKQTFWNWGSAAMTKLGEGLASAKEAVSGQFSQVMADIQSKGVGFAAGELLGKMYEGGRGFLLKVGEGINSAAPDLKNDINTAFNGVLSAFNYWHDNLAPHFLSSAKDLFGKIGVGLSSIDFSAGVNGAFNALLNAYNKWHDDLSPHFFSSTKDLANSLINGLIKGIKEGIGKVVSAIDGVAQAMPDWVKEKLGIHSPSTVFAGLGQNIVEGLVQGLQSMAGAPQAVLSDMTAGMMTGAAGGTVTTNNTTSTTNNWNVTIPTAGGNQPVDQMQSMFNTLTTIYAG